MKILVAGAGAVGGYYGARMAQAGFDVTFVARGSHYEKMKNDGLEVKSHLGDFNLQGIKVVDNFDLGEEFDLILFTVKTYDTEDVAKEIKPLVGDGTTVLTIQNGMGNAEKIGEVVGAEKVLPGLTKIGVGVEAPGVINHGGKGVIYIGEYSKEVTQRVQEIKEVLDKSEIENYISEDIKKDIWVKFCWNSIFNIISAITNLTTNRFFENEYGEALMDNIMEELKEVARADGIQILESDVEDIIGLGNILGEYVPSTLHDVRKRKRLEVDTFTGQLVELAKKYEISIPVNTTLYQLLKTIEYDIEQDA